MFGLIMSILSNIKTARAHTQKYTNIVVVVSGRSYEGISEVIMDSQFIPLEIVHESALAPISLLSKNLTVFDLEEIRHLQSKVITEQVIDAVKKATTPDTLLIIDEWWSMSSGLKEWALTEFKGSTLVSSMSEEDITQDNAYHLFESGVELNEVSQKRSRPWRV